MNFLIYILLEYLQALITCCLSNQKEKQPFYEIVHGQIICVDFNNKKIIQLGDILKTVDLF